MKKEPKRKLALNAAHVSKLATLSDDQLAGVDGGGGGPIYSKDTGATVITKSCGGTSGC